MSGLINEIRNYNKKERFLLSLAIILLALIISSLLIVLAPKQEAGQAKQSIPKVQTVNVAVTTEPILIESDGTLEPKVTVLRSETNGKVISIAQNFEQGMRFSKGESLLEIDPAEKKVELESAKLALKQAQYEFSFESALVESAKNEYRMAQSKKNLRKPSDLLLRKPQLEQARASLDLAKARFDKAKADHKATKLLAAFNGVVRNKQVEVGDFLQPGTVIGEIFPSESMEITLPVTERESAFLIGQNTESIKIELINETTKSTWQAKVKSISKEYDPETRFINIITEVVDPFNLNNTHDTSLLPGTFLKAKIYGANKQLIALPRQALKESDIVYIVKDSKISIQDVEVLARYEDRVLIAPTLEAGSQLVVSEISYVSDGMQISVIENEKNS